MLLCDWHLCLSWRQLAKTRYSMIIDVYRTYHTLKDTTLARSKSLSLFSHLMTKSITSPSHNYLSFLPLPTVIKQRNDHCVRSRFTSKDSSCRVYLDVRWVRWHLPNHILLFSEPSARAEVILVHQSLLRLNVDDMTFVVKCHPPDNQNDPPSQYTNIFRFYSFLWTIPPLRAPLYVFSNSLHFCHAPPNKPLQHKQQETSPPWQEYSFPKFHPWMDEWLMFMMNTW